MIKIILQMIVDAIELVHMIVAVMRKVNVDVSQALMV